MSAMRKNYLPFGHRQSGAILMLLLLLVSVGALAVFVTGLNRATQQLERDRVTAAALAQAKAALIGYAARSGLSTGTARPGDLPCPDLHPQGALEGTSSTPCNGNALGRLPWRTLGLPDLRDGEGERLWYAVSVNFKNSPRTPTLNSDTQGTISIRGAGGLVVNNGSGASGAVAVVLSPGGTITRWDGLQQKREVANFNNPAHFLDCLGSAPNICNVEDNQDFVNGSGINGFIQGEIKDAQGNSILNDRLITITYEDLMPLLERRVANEVRQDLIGMGYFPWAVSYSDPAALQSENFISQANAAEGLAPLYAYHWQFGGAPAPSYIFSGTVGKSDLESGFVEPGTCSGFADVAPSHVDCTGVRLILAGVVRRKVTISIDTTAPGNSLIPPKAFANGDMTGVLNITDTCIQIALPTCPVVGMLAGSGSVTGNSKITLNTDKSTSFPEWVSANNWHRLMYYAVSPGFAAPPVPTIACNPRTALPSLPVFPSCLRINNTSGVVDNKHAVIIMTGRALTTQNRSAGMLDSYLEGVNATIGDFDFDANGNQVSTSFNDRLNVVGP